MTLEEIHEKLTNRIIELEKRYPMAINLELKIVLSHDVDSIATNLTSDTKELIVNKEWIENTDNNMIDWTLLFISHAISLELYSKQKDFDSKKEKMTYNTAAAYFINNLIISCHDPELEIPNGILYSETYQGKNIDEISKLIDLTNLIRIKK